MPTEAASSAAGGATASPFSAAARLHLEVRGAVQGVGFRSTTNRLATGFSVSGYVKNLADGSVEVASTEPEEIARASQAIADAVETAIRNAASA